MTPAGDGWRRLFVAALTALLLLELLWEIWLAPVHAGSAWLALKVLPLVLVWPGVARGVRRPAQWALLLLPWYFAEGLVRAWSESGRQAFCAGTAAVVALVALGAGLMWMRAQRQTRRY